MVLLWICADFSGIYKPRSCSSTNSVCKLSKAVPDFALPFNSLLNLDLKIGGNKQTIVASNESFFFFPIKQILYLLFAVWVVMYICLCVLVLLQRHRRFHNGVSTAKHKFVRIS